MALATEIDIKQGLRYREKRFTATARPTAARNPPARRRGSGRPHTAVCGVFAESGLVGLVVPIEREFLALDADERELGTFQNYKAAWSAVAAAAGGVITRLARLKKMDERGLALRPGLSDPARLVKPVAVAPSRAEAFDRQLDNLIALAQADGAARERARIAAIMSSVIARTNMALAWSLAADGDVTLAAANEALALSLVASLPVPVGDSGLVLQH